MIGGSIAIWLWVFGGITSLLVFQFLFPRWYARTFNKTTADGDEPVFYLRQAGIAIAVQGLLLIWAGFDPNLRLPAVTLALVGKGFFVVMVYLNLKKFPGMLLTALVDTLACLVFAAYLLGY